MERYYIRLHWWRECHFRPSRTQNLTIGENPSAYLERQRARLGDQWTNIAILSCCPVGDDAAVSPDPDLGVKTVHQPLTTKQLVFTWLCIIFGLAVLAMSCFW